MSGANACASSDDAQDGLPSRAMIRALWGRMAALYGGARWASATSALPESDDGKWSMAARTWAEALAGICDAQIADGLRACLAAVDEWVPTPAMFRARCLGIPSLAAVRLMMRQPNMAAQSRYMLLVRRYLDHYAFARAGTREADAMLSDAYDVAVEHVMRGGELPPLPVAAIDPPRAASRTPASAETVAVSVGKIREAIGVWPTA